MLADPRNRSSGELERASIALAAHQHPLPKPIGESNAASFRAAVKAVRRSGFHLRRRTIDYTARAPEIYLVYSIEQVEWAVRSVDFLDSVSKYPAQVVVGAVVAFEY